MDGEKNCGVTLKSVTRLNDRDYVVEIKRPDGSIVSVMIPVERIDSYESRIVGRPERSPFGLNLAAHGHHA